MTQVRETVATVQGSLASLAGATDEARTSTATVPHEASPDATVASLSFVRDAVDRTRDATARTVSQVGDAQQLVVRTLHGGEPGPMLQALEAVKQVLLMVLQKVETALQLVNAATAEARQLGSAGKPSGLAGLSRPALLLPPRKPRTRRLPTRTTAFRPAPRRRPLGAESPPGPPAASRPARAPESR
ncbi:DUF6244 family protein [Polymorphospora sp. NPDC051019]|uniref:DUF6244 family protein n=1 Tax=Polymorphospora sp. NPDC051019 TaxID=3155725 RepID=UPI003444C6B6